MALLSSIDHDLLNEETIQILNTKSIYSVLDFLNEDVDEIAHLTDLTYVDIFSIQQHIYQKFNTTSISGLDLYEKIKESHISTGIPRLDTALKGGLPCGKITEVCGLPCSGKTQLVTAISCNVSHHLKRNIIYVDAKNDFSGSRIYQILKETGCEEKELASSMDRIKVVRLWNMNALIYFIHELHRKESLRNCVSLVVVDSLPCLMLQHKGEKSKESIGLLNLFVNAARLVGTEHGISFIIVNLTTRWNELLVTEEDGKNVSKWVEKKVPALGKYWQFIPTTFIRTDIDKSCELKKIDISVKSSCDVLFGNTISFELNSIGIK
ncbi:rad51 recombinase D [Arctopsyche grandis]|uniref:rad51 recombinase D n=1 Tax=Arctopsyche grandis TaxID=121162 RepID=UPI00406D77D1